jgi:hypothetical protein
MAKRTKTDHAKLLFRRLAEDEEVHGHLRTAAVKLREASTRAAAQRPRAKAVEDRKIYDRVREAATSLRKAGQKLRPKPEPPKRRGRKVVLVAATAGGTAYALKKRGKNGSEPASSRGSTGAGAERTTAGAPG